MSDDPKAAPPRSLARYLPLALIGALFAAFIGGGGLRRLSLGALAAHHAAMSDFVARHPIASLGAYLGVYLLIVVACSPGAAVMSVSGGFLFGPLLGGAAALGACVVGSTIVFLACRTAFGDWAAERAGPTVARIEAGFSRDAFAYLLALRLMPVAPMALVTIAAGLARVRLGAFLLATVIGTIPSVFVFAGLGAGLGGLIRRHAALDASLFERPAIALPLAGLAILALAPPLWRIRQARRAREGGR
jgi:uncharacterized membrane protein YdjX (TVP38/TMEM64 family)